MTPTWKKGLAVAGVALPAIFNFLATRLESNAAKIRTEVAYETMAKSVQELQEATHDQGLQIANLQGQLQAQERRASRREGPEKPVDAQPKFLSPPSLDKAMERFNAKK